MDTLIKKISNAFGIFKKNESGCNGCAYHKPAKDECNLFVITEDYKPIKAKDGCESYLCKNSLLKK